MTADPPSAVAVDVDGHVARITEQGYSVIPDAIDPDLVAELADDLARLERQLAAVPADNGFEGRSTVRIYNLLAHGPLYPSIPVHPNVLPVVEGVLDAGCLVSSLSSIAIDPGERAQPLHADDALIPLPKPHPPTVCNTMWALTDFTDANGATRVVPGSHTRDHDPDHRRAYDTVAAEMTAGSVLVWHGSLWHGGGANRTDRRRTGIAMNYCAGYIRQQENQQLGIPLDLVRSFPRRLQELCGFGTYQGLIGHIDKRRPLDVVLADDDAPHGMIWDGDRA